MLINEKYLKQFSPIPLNYNLDEVMNYVPFTEQSWILPILGSDLFDEIEQQVEDNELTDENATLLLEAVWPLEAFAVVLESLPFIYAHVSEIGMTKGKTENSESVDLKDVTFIQNNLRAQVEQRKDFLINWLCDRADSFPLYDSSKCKCSCSCNANKLNSPNPFSQLHSTPRIQTDIK